MNSNKSEMPQPPLQSEKFEKTPDELDLWDVIFELWRGRVIIFFSVLLMIIIAALYLASQEKRWTSKSIITLPSVGQVISYDAVLSVLYSQYPQDKLPIARLQRQLINRFNAHLMTYSKIEASQTSTFSLNIIPEVKGDSASLNVSVTALDAKQAQSELLKAINYANSQVVDEYLADIKRNLEQKENELTEYLKSQAQIADEKKNRQLEVQKHALKVAEASNIHQTPLRQLDSLTDDTLFLLGTDALKAMISNESSSPLEFGDDYYQTKRQLLSIKKLNMDPDELQSYSFVQMPDLPVSPDPQRRTLAIILAVVSGVILGSVLVLLRKALRRYLTLHQK